MTRRNIDDTYPPYQRPVTSIERVIWRIVFFGTYVAALGLLVVLARTIFGAVVS